MKCNQVQAQFSEMYDAEIRKNSALTSVPLEELDDDIANDITTHMRGFRVL